MDIHKLTLRTTVEATIKRGKHPAPEDLAELLRNSDISPVIGQYIADHYVMKTKQRLVGRKTDSALDHLTKQARALVCVQEIMDHATESGQPVTRAQAIERLAKQGLDGLSRSALFKLLK